MAVCEHPVSYVNGTQVMVRGLRLAEALGYQRGANVRVADPSDSTNPIWAYTVENDEHATLVSRHPPPPNWIRRGVVIRIEVVPPAVENVRPHASDSAKTSSKPIALQGETSTEQIAVRAGQPTISRALGCQTLFDAYIFVDWGAKNGPYAPGAKSDSPWLAEGRWNIEDFQWEEERWFSTRRELVDHARCRLLRHIEKRRRVLVGFDFAYGYPDGFGEALGLSDTSWAGVWTELASPTNISGGRRAPPNTYAAADNQNNRFEVAAHLNERIGLGNGPFYGCPKGKVGRWLQQGRPAFPVNLSRNLRLQEFRATEKRLLNAAKRPLSTWWVLGGAAPTVGGQILTGIPAVRELRMAPLLQRYSKIWPFETGFNTPATKPDTPVVIHAEIWPGTQASRVDTFLSADRTLTRDQAQVRAMVAWAANEDASGRLAGWFGAPTALSPSALSACAQQEGWILGV